MAVTSGGANVSNPAAVAGRPGLDGASAPLSGSGGNAGVGGPAPLGGMMAPPPSGSDAPRPSPGCDTAAAAPAMDQDLMLMHGGMARSYILHMPRSADPKTPIPLVLSIHGFTSSNTGQRAVTGQNDVADKHGFMVAYPQGTGSQRGFNAGSCCIGGDVDDVGFMRAIVDDVGKRACLDRRRVYATGISNGGMMSFRLACEADDTFAAVAPVVGQTWITPCNPKRGVPILSFNGTADMTVTYQMANPLNEMWAMRDQCTSGPVTEPIGTTPSRCKVWTQCRDGAEVRVCSMEGMTHCQPGRPNCNNQDIDANEAMAMFFERFRLPP
jgi:polyhydroxybutyrate depolymerase